MAHSGSAAPPSAPSDSSTGSSGSPCTAKHGRLQAWRGPLGLVAGPGPSWRRCTQPYAVVAAPGTHTVWCQHELAHPMRYFQRHSSKQLSSIAFSHFARLHERRGLMLPPLFHRSKIEGGDSTNALQDSARGLLVWRVCLLAISAVFWAPAGVSV